jgi:hypothetical protein
MEFLLLLYSIICIRIINILSVLYAIYSSLLPSYYCIAFILQFRCQLLSYPNTTIPQALLSPISTFDDFPNTGSQTAQYHLIDVDDDANLPSHRYKRIPPEPPDHADPSYSANYLRLAVAGMDQIDADADIEKLPGYHKASGCLCTDCIGFYHSSPLRSMAHAFEGQQWDHIDIGQDH